VLVQLVELLAGQGELWASEELFQRKWSIAEAASDLSSQIPFPKLPITNIIRGIR